MMVTEAKKVNAVRRRLLPVVLRRHVEHPAQAVLFDGTPPAGPQERRSTWSATMESLLAAGALAAFLALGMLAS